MSAISRLGLESGDDSDEISVDEYPMGYPSTNDDTTVGRFLVCEEDRRLYDDDDDDDDPDSLLLEDLRRTTTRGLWIQELLLLESFS